MGTFLRGFRWGHMRQLDRVSRELPGRAWAVIAEASAEPDDGHDLVAVCREKDVRFSIIARLQPPLRALIEAIHGADRTPTPWTDGPADMAETAYTPFRTKPDAQPVRLVVRRVKPNTGSPLALIARYGYHAFITDREGETPELEAGHRRHAVVENVIRDLKRGVGLNHLPSGKFAANAARLAVQVIAHNPVRRFERLCMDAHDDLPEGPADVDDLRRARTTNADVETMATAKTIRRRFFSLAGRLTHKARRSTLHLPQGRPWRDRFIRAVTRLNALPLPP